MKTPQQEKLMAAYQLLGQDILSVSAFENVLKLLKGFDKDLDEKLEICANALDKVQKIRSGDVVTLSAENLPEETDKQKKRKKAILFFIQAIKDLRSEIHRIQNEFSSNNNSPQDTALHVARIIKFAKGPFGLTTLIATVIVVGMLVVSSHKTQNVPINKQVGAVTKSTSFQKNIPGPVPFSQLQLGASTATHTVGNETLSAGCSGGTVPGITDSATVSLAPDAKGNALIKIVVSRGTFSGSVIQTPDGKIELDVTNASGQSKWVLTGLGTRFSGIGTTTLGACTISAPETVVFTGSGLQFASE